MSPSNILIAKSINVAAGEREVTAERTRRADHGAAQGPGAATQGEPGEATGPGFWRQSDTQAPGKSRPCTISCVCPPFVIVSSFSTYNTLSFYSENSLKFGFDPVFQTIVTITSINNNTLRFVVMN